MPTTVPIAASSNGANQLVAGVAGYKFRVLEFVLSFSGSVNAKFQSGSTDLTGLLYGAAGVVVASPTLPQPHAPAGPTGHFDTAAGEALNLNLSAGTAVGGWVAYERLPASA